MTEVHRPRSRRLRLIVGALAVTAVVAGGGAYAATQDDSPAARSQAIVDDAAGTLGVEPSKLTEALESALQKQVDAQVTAGRLTQEQAEAIKQRIADGTQPIFGGGPGGFGRPEKHFRHGPGFGHGPRGGALAAGVQELATYLGLTSDELRTQLRSGKSLAEIAKTQGKTIDGLKTAITAAVTKRLDAAVTAGKLTAERKQKLLDRLGARLDDVVDGVHKLRGFGHHGKGERGAPGQAPAAPADPADPPPADPASWSPDAAAA